MSGVVSSPPEPRRGVRRFSIRHRILFVVLGIGILPAAFILFLTTWSAVEAMRDYVLDQAQDSTIETAGTLGEELQEAAELLRDAAHTVAVLAPQNDGFSEMIGRAPFFASYPGARLVELENSRPVATWSRDGRDRSITNPVEVPASVVDSLDSRMTEYCFVTARPTGGNDGNSLWLCARIPGEDESTSSWLAFHVEPERMPATLRLERTEGLRAFYLVSSREGVIGSPPEDSSLAELLENTPDLFAASSGYAWPTPSKTEAYAFARVPLQGQGATDLRQEDFLYFVRPVEFDSATVALFYQVWKIAIFGLVCFVLLALFGIWFSKHLVDPIIRLRAAFNRLEMGDLDYRVEMHTGDELEELAESMNRMSTALQQTYRSLADKLLELDQKARQLALTHEIAVSLNRSLDLETLFSDILTQIRQLVSADFISLGVSSEQLGGRIDLTHVWHSGDEGYDKCSFFPLKHSLTAQCLRSGDLGVFTLRQPGSAAEERLLESTKLKVLCVLPLMTPSKELTGVLLVGDSDPNLFASQELEILRRISLSLAIAVEHGRLYEKQAQFATELERQVEERTAALKQAQTQLVVAEKLAATGELAANIAHEINNPLSIIKNYLKLNEGQLLRPTLDRAEICEIRDGMMVVGEEIDRIARIVDQLKRVRSPIKPEIRAVDLNEELRQLVKLYRHTTTEKSLSIEESYDSTMGPVTICSDFFRQIVINLLRNAHDAANPGGRIQVLTHGDSPATGWFTLAVRDDGAGIPEDILKKIFTPFFTTKRDGKGSGLGLSVSYGLAKTMGGRIEVTSREGHGAEFLLILPRDLGAPSAPPAPDESGITLEGERIIIG